MSVASTSVRVCRRSARLAPALVEKDEGILASASFKPVLPLFAGGVEDFEDDGLGFAHRFGAWRHEEFGTTLVMYFSRQVRGFGTHFLGGDEFNFQAHRTGSERRAQLVGGVGVALGGEASGHALACGRVPRRPGRSLSMPDANAARTPPEPTRQPVYR